MRAAAHSRTFAVAGGLLGLGAPLGFLALRSALQRRAPTPRWIAAELRRRPLTYGYLTLPTMLVFALFGRILGRREDGVEAHYAQIERLREEFAAIISHDLRDPIQVLALQVGILAREAREEEGEAFVSAAELRRLRSSCARLAQIADDLRDAAQVELGEIALDKRPVDPASAVTELVERLRARLGLHPVEIHGEGGVPAILADPARFDQIVTNLLENAAKYSAEQAPIRVTLAAERGGVAIAVEDAGIGIHPDEVKLLFDRFYQARRAREKKTGLGLGLYITRGLVEAHGGRIGVESVPGAGSTFRVWLPGG